jgi:hypothetical protein
LSTSRLEIKGNGRAQLKKLLISIGYKKANYEGQVKGTEVRKNYRLAKKKCFCGVNRHETAKPD